MTLAIIFTAGGTLITAALTAFITSRCLVMREQPAHIFRHEPLLAATVRKVKCRRCTGGMQRLNDDGWGKIPEHILLHTRDPDGECHHGIPDALVGTCACCQGWGAHFIQDKPGARRWPPCWSQDDVRELTAAGKN